MKLFSEWLVGKLNEATPVQSTGQIGFDPTRSAIEKLIRGIQNGELPNGYIDGRAMSTRFGLSPDELGRLQQSRIIGRNAQSQFEIKVPQLRQAYQQLSGQQIPMAVLNKLQGNVTPNQNGLAKPLPLPPVRQPPQPQQPGMQNRSPFRDGY